MADAGEEAEASNPGNEAALTDSAEGAEAPASLSHLDDLGHARMVNVTGKAETARRAVAEGEITFSRRVMDLLADRQANPKGDVFTVAKIAGVMAAKRTSELIPLCHPLPLADVDVQFTVAAAEHKVLVRAEATTVARTGVEMEALTAASVALLTLYDMLKSADKGLVIGNLRLTEKDGGKSGPYRRSEP